MSATVAKKRHWNYQILPKRQRKRSMLPTKNQINCFHVHFILQFFFFFFCIHFGCVSAVCMHLFSCSRTFQFLIHFIRIFWLQSDDGQMQTGLKKFNCKYHISSSQQMFSARVVQFVRCKLAQVVFTMD